MAAANHHTSPEARKTTTAVYTKPALVHPHDLGRVAQLRAGDPVAFAAAPGPAPTWYLERD